MEFWSRLRRILGPSIGRLLVASLALALVGPAMALDDGLHLNTPVLTSPAAPLRQALILAPSPGGGGVRSDADAYLDLLRRLGFEVTTVVADNRAELDGNLRQFAASVRTDSEVVVLVLGTALAKDKDLYVMPSADPTVQPQQLATSGVRIGDALNRIVARGPKDIVAIVDTCRDTTLAATDCAQTPSGLPDGVSGLVAYRMRNAGDMPMARIDSLRVDLTHLMHQPGLTVFALYGSLGDRLKGTDMRLAATPSLSRSFAFLPADFLARLPTPCNQVQATADDSALRTRSLDDLVTACTEAARTYDFSPEFASKLAIVREQVAFQRAVARCDDLAPADAFLQNNPGSVLRGAVERFKAGCEDARRQDEARQQAQQVQQPAPAPMGPTLVPRGDQQASFPCGGSLREPVAQLICADADLAAADFRLGLAYHHALAAAADRRAVIRDERDWVRRAAPRQGPLFHRFGCPSGSEPICIRRRAARRRCPTTSA